MLAFAFFACVECVCEMESRRMQKTEKGINGEPCTSDSAAAEPHRVDAEDVNIEEDRYVAAEEKPSTFIGTFSDSEDDLDTKFVH